MQDHENELYRRGMYVFIKRTVPPPSMLIFDASNRDQCEVQRSRTNTPLQALVMMNDPQVLEGARVMAENLVNEKTDIVQKLEKAFRKIICRKPKQKELDLLSDFYETELDFFKKNSKKADSMLKIGEFKKNPKLDKSQTAALMQTIQMIFNMEEAIMRV